MLERQGGLLDLAKAIGQELEFSGQKVPYQKYSAKGEKQGNMEQIVIAKPSEVLEFLKGLDGTVVRAHVKVEKGTGNYGDQNRVDYFIPSEESASSEDEYEMDSEDEESEESEEIEESDESSDEEVSEDEGSEDEETEEEPEEEPAPKAKVSSKVKQGPAKTGKSKR